MCHDLVDGNRISPSPECRASEMMYEIIVVFLFAHLPTPALLAARSFDSFSNHVEILLQMFTCVLFFSASFPTDFRAKETESITNLSCLKFLFSDQNVWLKSLWCTAVTCCLNWKAKSSSISILSWGTGMAQSWKHALPSNVAWIYSGSVPYMGWVCC